MPVNKTYGFVNDFKGYCRYFLFVHTLLEEREFKYLEELASLLLVEHPPQRKLP